MKIIIKDVKEPFLLVVNPNLDEYVSVRKLPISKETEEDMLKKVNKHVDEEGRI